MATIYIDNLHKQLYSNEVDTNATVSPGSSLQSVIGLADFGELPATAMWYIRKIVFSVQLWNAPGVVGPDTRLSVLCGIAPRDLVAGTNFSELDDYQDVNGWPLNGCHKMGIVQLVPQQNAFSWTKTYTPSKNLTLNRTKYRHVC